VSTNRSLQTPRQRKIIAVLYRRKLRRFSCSIGFSFSHSGSRTSSLVMLRPLWKRHVSIASCAIFVHGCESLNKRPDSEHLKYHHAMTLEASAFKAGSPRKMSYKYQHRESPSIGCQGNSCILSTANHQMPRSICTLFQTPSSRLSRIEGWMC
jgi:hypothetical protein